MEQERGPVVLNSEEWAIAKALARELARDVDRNELGKAVSYFQRVRSRTKFFRLLERLPQSGYTRSRRTRAYLERIAQACQRHLQPISDDRRALAVVSWSFRLMTQYQTRTGRRYARSRSKRPPRR
jgi:hypothetical protein